MRPEEIWAGYSLKLQTYILKHVPDQYEAEDILQEVGVRLQKNANKLDGIRNVEAWLYRIANNLIADYFRRAKKYFPIEDINEISVPFAPEPENFNQETAECLLKLVDYLPAADKEAIIESDYNGKKQRILGQKWGLSHSGSKTRIQRARKKLKAVLLNCCEVKSDNAGNIIELRNKEKEGTKLPV
jgi:RNA polymerase sigma-70 factor (ECF subfamily)